jgi:NAD(P)H-quinone oxidoreductase subunit 5
MVLVLSGNLAGLAVAWSATSIARHRLLLFYRERPGAVVAARKKFVVARLGDVCLVAAVVLLARELGMGDVGALLERAPERFAGGAAVPLPIHLAAGLLVLTAIFKAAQFSAHGWLIEMQETPTPVSALLHAGILNGGTFLVARLFGVVQLSTPALAVLVVVGGFTAAFSSVVMITDTRVKATLAYSSAAHMGFMLLLCGMGAGSVAIVHLVAHSFYKAHAFLSSGSAVEVARAGWVLDKGAKLPLGRIFLAYAATALFVWGAATVMG